VRLAGTAFDAADDFVAVAGRDVRFDAIVRGKLAEGVQGFWPTLLVDPKVPASKLSGTAVSITAAARAPTDNDHRCKSLFFNSLSVSRLKVHVIMCHLKKLLFTVASIGVFTLNGVSPIQLVAVIAFSAGVYATRFRA